ncbi:thioesterase-like superfamily-domain-containing protein [Phyllosticta citribraziliensis]|uniref:Thioesterase-like superfamily-domain-containing protein n=1 Tax=Phyllosticta citribraziliensis TaxID=989973 RepID=A0ABR1LZ47_9PEZI
MQEQPLSSPTPSGFQKPRGTSIPLTNPTSFAPLVALERLSATTFTNVEPVVAGGARVIRGRHGQAQLQLTTYGGLMFAQAAWAAAETIGSEWVIHNVTGTFLAPGVHGVPFTYHVRSVLEGKSFCLRAVEATQSHSRPGSATITNCRVTVSFKKLVAANPSQFDHQPPRSGPVQHALARFRAGASPHPNTLTRRTFPTLEAMLGRRQTAREPIYTPSVAGVEAVFMPLPASGLPRSQAFPNPRACRKTTALYTAVGRASEFAGASANLSICAHLNAADGMTLFDAAALLGFPAPQVRALCTLGLNVVIHDAGSVGIAGDGHKKKWYVQEGWVDRYADERVVFCTRVWDERGVCVLSSWQEGVLKLREARL